MQSTQPTLYGRFWFLWLVITVVYIVGYALSGISIIVPFLYLIGLFVPFGIWNALQAFSAISTATQGAFSIVLLVFSLLFADAVANKLKVNSVGTKVFFNLAWLLILTLVVDLLLWGKWESLDLFVKSITLR